MFLEEGNFVYFEFKDFFVLGDKEVVGLLFKGNGFRGDENLSFVEAD